MVGMLVLRTADELADGLVDGLVDVTDASMVAEMADVTVYLLDRKAGMLVGLLAE